MPTLLRTFLTLACALYLGGAHWMVLQVTAWTGMLLARAPEVGVSLAIETTFDGKHPCRACAAVTEGQNEARRQQPVSTGAGKVQELKLVALVRDELPPCKLVGEMRWPDFTSVISRGMDAPPTPPPLA